MFKQLARLYRVSTAEVGVGGRLEIDLPLLSFTETFEPGALSREAVLDK